MENAETEKNCSYNPQRIFPSSTTPLLFLDNFFKIYSTWHFRTIQKPVKIHKSPKTWERKTTLTKCSAEKMPKIFRKFPDPRYRLLVSRCSSNVCEKLIKPFPCFQDGKKAEKHETFGCLQNFPLKYGQHKTAKISRRTLRFIWPLTVSQWVIQISRGICTLCR